MKKNYIIILSIMITAFIGIKNINASEIKPSDLLNVVTTAGELPSSGFGNAGFNHSDLCTPLKTENGANGKRKP